MNTAFDKIADCNDYCHMKKLLSLIVILFSIPLFAAISPQSKLLGPVATDIEDGSITALAKEAFGSYFGAEWLEKYSVDDDLFAISYGTTLSRILPMDNLIFGKEGKDSLSFYSLDSNILISLVFSEGRIAAMDVKMPKSQTDQEGM